MNLKQILIVFIVCLIPFLFYFASPNIIGFDSYAYVNNVCFGQSVSSNWGADFVFSLLPCNFIVFKVLLFIVFFICTLTTALIGELFDSKKGWLVFLFVCSAPIWFGTFVQFENDFLAFPFLFIGIYLTFKASYVKTLSNNQITKIGITGLGLICLSALFWKGAIFYLLAVGLIWWYPLVLFVFVLLTNWNDFIALFIPRWNVAENLPFLGIALNGLMLLGFWKTKKDLILPLFVIGIIALINSKFAFLLIPLLVPGFVNGVIKAIKFDKLLNYLLIVLVFAIWIGAGVAVWFAEPNEIFWSALDFAQEQSKLLNKPLKNEWSYGYWLKFKGVDTNSFAYGIGVDCSNAVCITQLKQDCELLKQFNQYFVYNCSA